MAERVTHMHCAGEFISRPAKSYIALQTVCHHFNIYKTSCVALALCCRDGQH